MFGGLAVSNPAGIGGKDAKIRSLCVPLVKIQQLLYFQ